MFRKYVWYIINLRFLDLGKSRELWLSLRWAILWGDNPKPLFQFFPECLRSLASLLSNNPSHWKLVVILLYPLYNKIFNHRYKLWHLFPEVFPYLIGPYPWVLNLLLLLLWHISLFVFDHWSRYLSNRLRLLHRYFWSNFLLNLELLYLLSSQMNAFRGSSDRHAVFFLAMTLWWRMRLVIFIGYLYWPCPHSFFKLLNSFNFFPFPPDKLLDPFIL